MSSSLSDGTGLRIDSPLLPGWEVCRLASLGVRDALRAHKQAGCPVMVWRDGRAVALRPDEIPDDPKSEGIEDASDRS